MPECLAPWSCKSQAPGAGGRGPEGVRRAAGSWPGPGPPYPRSLPPSHHRRRAAQLLGLECPRRGVQGPQDGEGEQEERRAHGGADAGAGQPVRCGDSGGGGGDGAPGPPAPCSSASNNPSPGLAGLPACPEGRTAASPEAATTGPTALARAPRLRSVPMTVPFCRGEPVGERGQPSGALRPPPRGWPRARAGPLTVAGDHGGQAGDHDGCGWGDTGEDTGQPGGEADGGGRGARPRPAPPPQAPPRPTGPAPPGPPTRRPRPQPPARLLPAGPLTPGVEEQPQAQDGQRVSPADEEGGRDEQQDGLWAAQPV